MTDIYKGPVVLRGALDHDVKIGYVELWHLHEPLRTLDGSRSAHVAPWRGQGRVPGLLYRLLDVLGGEVTLILPDGRTGKAFATGYAQDSAWIIELAGIGKAPE